MNFLFLYAAVLLATGRAVELNSQPEGYYCYGDGHLHTADPCRFFAAIIDAGSTGTRLHLYRFVHNPVPHSLPFVTEKETFKEVKPGLSSFNENPKGAAASVRELLHKAHETIPPEMWEKTPIALKATAGLRLLPKEQADEIMSQVSREVHSSGFYVVENGVEILNGQDEGVFSWFTLNLLLNTLYRDTSDQPSDPLPERSVAAFDLGGGSTQVTFWPSDESIFERDSNFRRDIDFFDTHMHLFSHSFLGNGLIAARLGILQGSSNDEQKSLGLMSTACMPVDFEISSWDYALKSWKISGSIDYSYKKCLAQTQDFIKNSSIFELEYLKDSNSPFDELKGHRIYLSSYFFDRGFNAGLVKDLNGGETTLEQFGSAAKKACSRDTSFISSGKHWLPWQCLDLTYIYALLRFGYGFEETQPLFLAKKMRDMEVSWGQGLAYSLVNSYHEHALPDIAGRSNDTGIAIVDEIVNIIVRRTNDVLQFLNIIS